MKQLNSEDEGQGFEDTFLQHVILMPSANASTGLYLVIGCSSQLSLGDDGHNVPHQRDLDLSPPKSLPQNANPACVETNCFDIKFMPHALDTRRRMPHIYDMICGPSSRWFSSSRRAERGVFFHRNPLFPSRHPSSIPFI